MSFLNRIPRFILILIVLGLVIVLGLLYYFFGRNTTQVSNLNTLENAPTSNATQTYTSTLSKVEPAAPVSFTEYKTLDVPDGNQVLSVPRELLTREPFATAVKNNSAEGTVFNSNDLFIYNPKDSSVKFLGVNISHLDFITIQNKEAWIFTLSNLDGTEEMFYSLPNFERQRLVQDFPTFPITKWNKISQTKVEVTVNQSQRGELLVKYTIDFNAAEFNTDRPDRDLTDKPPIVTSQKI